MVHQSSAGMHARGWQNWIFLSSSSCQCFHKALEPPLPLPLPPPSPHWIQHQGKEWGRVAAAVLSSCSLSTHKICGSSQSLCQCAGGLLGAFMQFWSPRAECHCCYSSFFSPWCCIHWREKGRANAHHLGSKAVTMGKYQCCSFLPFPCHCRKEKTRGRSVHQSRYADDRPFHIGFMSCIWPTGLRLSITAINTRVPHWCTAPFYRQLETRFLILQTPLSSKTTS